MVSHSSLASGKLTCSRYSIWLITTWWTAKRHQQTYMSTSGIDNLQGEQVARLSQARPTFPAPAPTLARLSRHAKLPVEPFATFGEGSSITHRYRSRKLHRPIRSSRVGVPYLELVHTIPDIFSITSRVPSACSICAIIIGLFGENDKNFTY
jgi:hypothetical protein